MVSVRKSHVMTETSFELWLQTLELSKPKRNALETLWQTVHLTFGDNLECQNKSLEMVEILAGLNLDSDSLCAAFLVPLVEYKLIDINEIPESFGQSIYSLCNGVAQMDAIRTLQQTQTNRIAANQIDNIRRMLLAMVEDVRAVVIKLAERLCYLRIVKNKDEETRVLAAKETENIYAPLANRLGIGQLKWELEDIAFRYLHPDVYMKIAKLLDEKRLVREQYMINFVKDLQSQLDAQQIKGHVYGRPKHIFSIWKKMQKKSLDFDQLFDVRAVRVLVDKLQDCYTALGIVHTSWKHLPKEFDDYVATPKANGYQSIHTVVLGPEGKPVEVQIRTEQMHQDAELGVAAHWRYKEGSAHGKTSSFDDKISWLRKILQWQDDVSENGDMLEDLRSQVFEDRIYAFTPNGDVIDLPAGSTPLDFAYYIHSNVGHCCIGAKVSGRIVPFTYQLQTGDQVEILTSKKANPSRDWLNQNLNYLHSPRSRSKVQHFFKLLDRDKHVAQGKEQYEAECQKLNLTHIETAPLLKRFNMTSLDDLYASIGNGNTRLQQVINFIRQKEEKLVDDIDPKALAKPSQSQSKKSDKNGIVVSGVGNLLTHIANCCKPVPGDDILGFITQGRGISVHRQDCEQLANILGYQPEREVAVQWGHNQNQNYQASIRVTANDRQGLIRDISTIIANERVLISDMDSRLDKINQLTVMNFTLEIANKEVLARTLSKLRQLDDVIDVIRVHQ